jgi:hypothetical protein
MSRAAPVSPAEDTSLTIFSRSIVASFSAAASNSSTASMEVCSRSTFAAWHAVTMSGNSTNEDACRAMHLSKWERGEGKAERHREGGTERAREMKGEGAAHSQMHRCMPKQPHHRLDTDRGI